MKDKLVVWGANEKDEKLLLGIQLIPDENKIEIYTFPEAIVKQSFEDDMMGKWRKGEEVDFPEGFTKLERELVMSESILPDDIKTKETDLINRAKSEWHFVVLSRKLSQSFKDELEEIKETIDQLSAYDSTAWNDLKKFWSKVQRQIRDHTLVWQHAKEIKETTNGLFDKLKGLRTQMEGEIKEKSGEYHQQFMGMLDEVDTKIKNDARLSPIFNELKSIQKKFWDTKFISEHRNEIKKRLDVIFQEVKSKRFGDKSAGSGPQSQLDKRLDGLDKAIGRMQNSIQRDKKELEFQHHRIKTTDGQLEAQIRQAKIMVVEERINSKTHKLEDMLKTKTQLEGKLAKVKERLAKEKAEAERKKQVEEAKVEAKERIAEEIKSQEGTISQEEADKLEKAAKELAAKKTKKEAAKPDTPKDEVPTDDKKAPEKIVVKATKITAETNKKAETIKVEAEEAPKSEAPDTEDETPLNTETPKSETSVLDDVADMIGHAFEDIVDSVKAVSEVLEDKIEDFLEGDDDKKE